MASTTTDRLAGVTAGLASKAPVRAATTANITLSGTQTIDSVAVVADDRVLVKNQTDGIENGVYDAKSGAWVRALDFDGARDIASGTFVIVTSGGTNGNTAWRISTADPITIGTTSIAFVAAIWSSASGVDVESTGSTTARSLAKRFAEAANVLDFGATGDGVADDTTEFQAAITAALAADVPVIVPGGKTYLIDGLLDCFRVSMIGVTADDRTTIFDESQWPVLKMGSTVTDLLRVGQATAGNDLSDRTVLENFTIDMTGAVNNARAVFCAHGVNFKTIRNIFARSTADTIANLVTANQIGFDLKISDTATQGLYYLKLDRLRAQNLFRGFYTSGDTNDGMRVSDIGWIGVWDCVQAITFKDSSNNDIDVLHIGGFLSGYDAKGQPPTEWGIYMDYKWNSIGNVYLESVGTNVPEIFATAQHNWNMIRGLENSPNTIQVITEAGTRVVGSQDPYNMGIVAGKNMLEVGSLGGPQTQKSLTVNPHFAIWTGGSANIANDVKFAHVWTSIKDGTGTLAILERTGSSNTLTFDTSVRLEINSPQADKLYGFGQDLLDHFPISGSVLQTIGRVLDCITVAVVCRPFTGNSAAMRVRIEVDQGVSSTNENYIVDYDQVSDATQDEPIVGASGEWYTLIHQVDINANLTKLDIRFGIYQSGTTDADIHVDGIYVIAGRHTQYGVRPLLEPPQLVQVPNAVANVNTPSGATAKALEIFDKDGASLGFIPVYSSQW